MLKWLRLLAIPALIAAVVLVTRHYKDYDTSPKGYDARCIQENQSSAAAGYLVCSIETNQKAEPGKPQPQWWDKLLSWPEGITAWLVMFTLYAIVWQTWETRKAAEATEDAARAARDSIRLQEAAMEQWVKIVNWSVVVGNLYSPTGGIARVGFEIVNGSQFPLTMLNAQLVFSGHTIYSTGDNVFMAPDTPYVASVLLPLTPDDVTQYESSILTVRITGDMSHVGRLGKTISQGFSGFLVFGDGAVTYFREEVSMVPKETEQNS